MAVGVHLGRRRFGEKIFQAISQLFELGIPGEELLDLDAKFSAFPAGLVVRKYVIVVLHDGFFGVLWRDHTIDVVKTNWGISEFL